jgi:hypothetical protein
VSTEERKARRADVSLRRRGQKSGPIVLVLVDEHPVRRAGVRTLLELLASW